MTGNRTTARGDRHRVQAPRLASLLVLLGLSACGGGGDGGIVTRVTTCTITGVSVQPSATTLSVGESTPLQALPSSQNCTSIPAAVWTSGSPSVASVNGSGQVTAVTPGTAVITASIGSASGSSVVTVRVPPVASIFITPAAPAPLQVGQTVTLTAEPRDAGGRALTGRVVTWQSSATNIATVTSAGVVSAVAPGSATITASSEGINQPVSITVAARPPASIELTVPSTTLTVGQNAVQATAIVRDAAGVAMPNETVSWTSTATGVATVTNGLISAVAPGQTTIRVTSNSTPSVTASTIITVNSGGAASVTITLPATMDVLQAVTATAVVRDAAGTILPNANVTWTSSVPTVASIVSTTGLVSSVSAGTTNITATVVGAPSVFKTQALTVTARVATVNIAQSNVLLEPGPNVGLTSQQLDVTLKDAAGNVLTGRTITYTSSNTAVATVNTTGLVSAVGVGTGTITVTSEGVSSSVTLIVARAFAVVDANQPTNTNTYQPPQISSAGSLITVTRTSTGQYSLSFAGIGLAATTIGRNFAALVNATNSSINSQLQAPTAMCAMSAINATGPTTITVFCNDPVSLALKDAAFKVILIGDNSVGGTGDGAAFSLRSGSLTTTYTPNSVFAWNSAGGAMTITPGFGAPDWGGTQVRHSMGLTFGPQHALVAPFIATAGQTCELQSQLPASLFTDVVCFDRNGPVAAAHTVVKLSSGRPGKNGGLAFFDAGTGVAFAGGFNSAGGSISTSRTGPGRYTVVFGGMVASGALGVMASPWGTSGWAACSHFVASTNPVTIDVACFNAFGAFANAGSALVVLVLQ